MDCCDLQDYAFMAYHAYYSCMKHAGGNYQYDPKKDMKHWTKIARLSVELDTEPETIIGARFDSADEHLRRTFRPAQMHSPKKVIEVLVKKYQENKVSDFNKMWEIMVSRLDTSSQRMIPRVYKSQADILADPNQPFTSWFRVLYLDYEIDKINEWYLDAAAEECRTNPKLRTYIEENINGRNAERIWQRLQQDVSIRIAGTSCQV